jgi:hypothetical protein
LNDLVGGRKFGVWMQRTTVVECRGPRDWKEQVAGGGIGGGTARNASPATQSPATTSKLENVEGKDFACQLLPVASIDMQALFIQNSPNVQYKL